MKRGIFGIAVALIIVGVLLVFLVSFQVRISEHALVRTFGETRKGGVITEPGLYFRWPYPIQTVVKFDTRMHVTEADIGRKAESSKYQEVFTADRKTIIITVAMGWSVDDPELFYNKQRTVERAKEQLRHLVAGRANPVIGKHPFSDFVSLPPKKPAFDQIEDEIFAAVKDTAAKDYGVRMHFVRLTQLGLPEEVTKQVFERMKAERARDAKRYRAEGARDAKGIRVAADRKGQETLSDAEAKAKEIRAKGDAETINAYKTFAAHEEFAIFLRELEALRKLKDRQTIIIDTRTPPWNLLKGDLDQLLKKPAAAAPTSRGN